MIRQKGSIENDIALRQLVMKDENDKSWFMFVRGVLKLYGLPSIFQLFSNPPSKTKWKRLLNNAVNITTEAIWEQDIKNKPSLKYVNTNALKVGKSHHVWSTVRKSIHDSRRAQLKSKLLTGTYILQGNRAAFNQYQVNSICKLCSAAPETRQHFISECAFLQTERSNYTDQLLKNPALNHTHSSQVNDPEFLTQLTLDASAVIEIEQCDGDNWRLLELQTREYIHKIHHKRLSELKRLSVFWATYDSKLQQTMCYPCKYLITSVNRAHKHQISHNSHSTTSVDGSPKSQRRRFTYYNNNIPH